MTYFIKTISLSFDPLSVFFLAVIAVVSLPSALYAVGYLKGHYSRGKIAAGWVLFTVFVLSMALVVTAKNAFLFLIAWELMSLVSYFLVVFDHTEERSVRAGTIYIVMTHIGTAFIIMAILLMYKHAGSFDFDALKTACLAMSPRTKDILFIFFFIGFGTKAGIVPLHLWLPYAHPQAPSHVSSVMSGVMIKTAVYGLIRFVMMIMGIQSSWWGLLILAAAIVSCLVGIMYALMENDIKRLLAYSSVENMGIILLGVGSAFFFASIKMPFLAVLGLVAGLYHLLNHALYKGLLFLCAGSVYRATGERDIEKLGGLIKVMPWTAAAFLVGSMAVSALPPLNGFVSEWLTLQTFLLGALWGSAGTKVFMGLLVAILALTGGLAAACFVKAFGITFLAMPRSTAAAGAKESPMTMKIAMAFLAGATVCTGLAAVPLVKIMGIVAGSALGADTTAMRFSAHSLSISLATQTGAYLSPVLIGIALVLGIGTAAVAVRLACGNSRVVTGRTWGCGYYHLDARTEYTGTAFSKPFRIAFDFFLLPYRKTEKIRDSYYHVKSFRYELYTTPIFKRYVYRPALAVIMRTATCLKEVQQGSIHLYISYILLTIILLILFMGRF